MVPGKVEFDTPTLPQFLNFFCFSVENEKVFEVFKLNRETSEDENLVALRRQRNHTRVDTQFPKLFRWIDRLPHRFPVRCIEFFQVKARAGTEYVDNSFHDASTGRWPWVVELGHIIPYVLFQVVALDSVEADFPDQLSSRKYKHEFIVYVDQARA